MTIDRPAGGVQFDVVYLSPHLDDVALSCGGQIFKQSEEGKSVLILTIMAGDPPPDEPSEFALSLHKRWELAARVVATRRQEDVAACVRLGANYLHLDVPDCIYRRHPATGEALYASERALFGPLHPAEDDLAAELAGRLSELLSGRPTMVPLGVGNHVDHQLTRKVAEACLGRDAITYYEDFPYVRRESAAEAMGEREEAWRPQIVPLAEAAVQAKIEAISCYRSQLSTFFDDAGDLEGQIRSYVHQVGGERLWRYAPL